jgi:GNAT superfamily N-acetyltransferase
MATTYALRLANTGDVPALETLIAASARALQAPFYTPAQIDAALGPVFAVDGQLIADRTYYVAEFDGSVIACGGWSKRATLFGRASDTPHVGNAVEWLDPRVDAARIRAFFVHPSWARRGIGTALLHACQDAATAAGFADLELVATLSGVPLYEACAFSQVERSNIPLANGLSMPVVRMRKPIGHRRNGDDAPTR